MDILAASREVGSYRGAAAMCGTTHKTVRRVVERLAFAADQNGGYRVGCQAQVRHCAWPDLLPFTRLSKLFVQARHFVSPQAASGSADDKPENPGGESRATRHAGSQRRASGSLRCRAEPTDL